MENAFPCIIAAKFHHGNTGTKGHAKTQEDERTSVPGFFQQNSLLSSSLNHKLHQARLGFCDRAKVVRSKLLQRRMQSALLHSVYEVGEGHAAKQGQWCMLRTPVALFNHNALQNIGKRQLLRCHHQGSRSQQLQMLLI